MFCENCGTKLEDGTLFCTNCGAKQSQAIAPDFKPEETVVEEATQAAQESEKVEEVVTEAQEPVAEASEAVAGEVAQAAEQVPPVQPGQQYNQQQGFNQQPGQQYNQQQGFNQQPGQQFNQQPGQQFNQQGGFAPKQPGTGMDKSLLIKILIIVGVVVVALIGVIAFLKVRANTINLNKYVEVEFTGYDTVGNVEVTIDPSFYDDLYDKSGTYASEWELEDYISYTVDPDSSLSNGDVVTIDWKVNEKYIKKHWGIKVKYSESETYTVKDLEEVEVFSPFGDDVTISSVGIEGDGEVVVEVNSDKEVYKKLTYYISGNYNLSEGDTVTIQLESSNYDTGDALVEYCAENFGMVPDATEYEYTVTGLGSYVTECSQLTDDNLADMKSQAVDVIKSQYTDADDGVAVENAEFKGTYVLSSKYDSYYTNNYVYLVYYVTVSETEDGQSDSFSFYTYISFSNVSINDDGVLGVNLGNYGRTYHSITHESSISNGYWTNRYYFYGYESVSDMTSDIETDNLADYNVDNDVTE